MDYTSSGQHLAVLVHGLWGNPNHLEVMARSLREKHPEETLHILVAKRNSGSFTYDGIELGGERIYQEIIEEVEKLARVGQHIKKLSLVGYSLVGFWHDMLLAYLIVTASSDKVEPVNFTAFASPFLGIRTPIRGWYNHLWNVLGARTLSASGRQLFTIDKFRDTGRPLLEILADPESIFIKGLAKFRRRTLYANIVNDLSAVYYTTGVSKTDPFTNLDKIKINYVKGYEDVIIDSSNPIAPNTEESNLSFYGRLVESIHTTIGRLPFLLVMIFFIPLGAVAFLVTSLVQSHRSYRRIRLYESGLAGIQPGNYRVPLLITGVREAVEDVYENLNSAQSNEYLAAGTEEEATHDELSPPMSETSPRSHASAETMKTTPITNSDAESSALPLVERSASRRQCDVLALAPYQFRMIQSLDNIGWRKYPVHIHNVRHSHAAIICRKDKPSFGEGRIVFRHWLDEEFII